MMLVHAPSSSSGDPDPMKSPSSRLLASLVLALVTWLMLAGASAPAIKKPDKLVILSTTDVKGKTSPCG